MRQFLWAIVVMGAAWGLCVTPGVTAQESEPDQQGEAEARQQAMLLEFVARAERLRDFGYPLLAREQLDHAKSIDPTAKSVLLGYLRLFTLSEADERDTQPYVKSLLELYPRDYDSCLEIARWIEYTQPIPTPPSTATAEDLNQGLERLKAEMTVYRELARFIDKPEGELPASAEGKPALPLAFLARCALDTPGTAEVLYLAATDLDSRGYTFDRWSRTDEKLAEPFGRAAHELYQLAVPLYRKAAQNDEYAASCQINLANLLFRLGKYDEARKAIVAAELLAPRNLTTAQTLLSIAEQKQDTDVLIEALTKLHNIYLDITSQLDLMAARRVKENQWSFDLWLAWSELKYMYGPDRLRSIRALLQAKPEFLEVYFLDALFAMELADVQRGDPAERAKLLRSAIVSLENCELLGDELADWHRLRGTCLWQLGLSEEAAEAFARTAELDPRDAAAKRFAKAGKDIAKGLYTADDFEVYRTQLEGWGDMRDKVKRLEAVVGRSPKFFEAQLLLGKAAFMTGAWEVAYKAYKAGHELVPENLECLDGVARAGMRSERYDEAYAYFKKLNDTEPDYAGCERWMNMMKDVVAGGKTRQRAFQLWLESTGKQISPTKRTSLLEEAIFTDPDFAEPRIEMAALLRAKMPEPARTHLEACLVNPRDKYVRAAVYRELGRLELSQKHYQRAVSNFESAYSYLPGDGTDLLLAALALHDFGDEEGASERMRKLFNELPTTGLLRPKPEIVNDLNLIPVESDGPLEIHPRYQVGDKLSFGVEVTVQGEGGGQDGLLHSTNYDLQLEVTEIPAHGGIWKFKLSFSNAPLEFAALNQLQSELQISPWFGLLQDPALGKMGEVANPAVQAICEAFTAGLGDTPLAPPYVWKNDLTVGPPHFGGDEREGICIAERLGDSYLLVRRANAGRRVGDTRAHESYSRGLETTIRIGGPGNAVRSVTIDLARKGLSAEKDDVISSWLQVKLNSK